MKVYEKVTKDLDSFLKFIDKLDIGFDCDLCKKYGLYSSCNDNYNCNYNLKQILKMDYVEIKEEDKQFDLLMSKIKDFKEIICCPSVYTNTNYIRNILNKNLNFSDNQKSILYDELMNIKHSIDHVNTLGDVIEKLLKINKNS